TFPALFGRLGEHGVAPAGPPFVRYLDTGDDRLEVELGVPVPGDATEFDGAERSTLPGGRVAVWRYVGPYSGLREACEQLGTSVKELGEKDAGPCWEGHVREPAARAGAALLTRSFSGANASGVLPTSVYQVFHASTWGSVIDSMRGPLLPTISRGARSGAGISTASSACQ